MHACLVLMAEYFITCSIVASHGVLFLFEMSVCVVSVCFKVPAHLHSLFFEQQVWLGRFRIPSLAGLAKTCQRRTLRWLVSQ